MNFLGKSLISAALLLPFGLAGNASATNYDITLGSSLTAEISTTPLPGGDQAVTGITGTFLGEAITGLIADPYSPAVAYYYQSVRVPQDTNTYPTGMTGTQYYYTYDNLLLTGNSLDSAGLFFQTADDLVNLYYQPDPTIAYSPIGVNVPGEIITGPYSISAIAAVPEPATWAMMILGFGLVGFAMRRRNVATRLTYAA